MVLEGALQAQAALRGKQTMTIPGALNYQACDDKERYNPVTVPLSWNLTLRPLVFQHPAQTK